MFNELIEVIDKKKETTEEGTEPQKESNEISSIPSINYITEPKELINAETEMEKAPQEICKNEDLNIKAYIYGHDFNTSYEYKRYEVKINKFDFQQMDKIFKNGKMLKMKLAKSGELFKNKPAKSGKKLLTIYKKSGKIK